jgi:2-(1,2-epoxy-1,2-dihydrophenyl)acetyl-CoA isomerase
MSPCTGCDLGNHPAARVGELDLSRRRRPAGDLCDHGKCDFGHICGRIFGAGVLMVWGAADRWERGVDKVFGDVSACIGVDFVATAEIRRPPDNFFDAALIASLADACEWAQAGARAIMLCSEGKHFCAGADFSGRSQHARPVGSSTGASELYDQALRLFEVPIPIVAAVQGAAVGGGLGLACAADFRVASAQSRFSANFARIGLHQGFGLSATLPAIIGRQRATDMFYTGRRVGGEEALRIGLADRLAEPAGLRAAAAELAAEIAGAGPLAVRAIRATMRAGLAEQAKAAMEHELAEQGKLWQTSDFAEGIRASAERRAPRFEGR